MADPGYDNTSGSRREMVRPYAVTRGRTEPIRDIAVEALIATTAQGRHEARLLGWDKQQIAEMCGGQPLSLAEVAVRMRSPLGVARVLVADMAGEGLLILHGTAEEGGYHDRMELLERVLSGLRRL